MTSIEKIKGCWKGVHESNNDVFMLDIKSKTRNINHATGDTLKLTLKKVNGEITFFLV